MIDGLTTTKTYLKHTQKTNTFKCYYAGYGKMALTLAKWFGIINGWFFIT